jgi:iron complex outermembrane receptor protein
VILTRPEKSRLRGRHQDQLGWRRVTANLNLYNNTITDYQDTQIDPNNPRIGSYLTNVGKVRLRGEFEA